MATTTIPWGDGSGDNIYLTYSSASGDQTVEVSSDANTGLARTKDISFSSGVGSVIETLTVSQEAGVEITTATFCPSSYDTTNSVYQSWSAAYPARNGYDYVESTNYAAAAWKNGANAETKLYWKFNTSSIPSGATIVSVSMDVKARMSWLGYQSVTPYLVVCEGTTEKGTHMTGLATSTKTFTMNTGSGWTRDSIQNISVLFYNKRGTSSTTYGGYQQFFGATLTVKYYI